MVRRPLIAAAVALVLAGCGNDEPAAPEPAPQPPATTTTTTGDAVAWAERVCSSVAPEVKKLSAGPDIDPNDPKAAKTNLVAYLDTLVAALDRMTAAIRDAGAPPVPDGEVAADRAMQTLQEAKTQVEQSRTELAAADVSNQAAFQKAFTNVGEDLQRLSELENPMAGLRGNEELDAAFEKAPSCRTLAGSDPSGSTTPSVTGSPTPSAPPTPTTTS
ncbi:hypothetical protein [Actinokineospora fastidiosa]|uniref:Small secreted protein n=1 Tax=Actinokineospora fastidiosa TaxID=1816 RepID=A0A918L7Z2_9PSEU|nr:hypothetical protein [Actinokineospora fastidiosa]GGS17016.1 hypothetical protein GCM10010171_06610 [Actinokineospora fastidiosa]